MGPRPDADTQLMLEITPTASGEGRNMTAMIREHPHLFDALEGALGVYHSGTARHADRVRALANLVAAELGLRGTERETVSWAAWLHDIGKMGVPAELLTRNGPLTDAEWVEVKRHPVTGADMLLALSPELAAIAAGVRAHHERWDGGGYPDGLAGEEIPRVGRIVAVADAYDAIAHARPYRSRVFTPDEAISELEAAAGSHLDPEVVAALVGLHHRGRLSLLS
jgi:putative nucleotidyltransferase with HDIG domain